MESALTQNQCKGGPSLTKRACFHGILLVSVLVFQVVSALAASETGFDSNQLKKVVMLYSGPPDFPATEMTEKGIREYFFNNPTFHIQLFSEYLDLSRFRDARHRAALADLLRQRYANGAVDLVMSVDVPAADFLMEHAEMVFPQIPIVMCSIPEALWERVNGSPLRIRTSGVLEPTNARDVVRLALSLKSDTKRAVLVSGSFENDRVRSVGFRKAIEALGDRVELIDLSGLSIEELIERCRQLPRDAIVFYSTFFVDERGRSFVPRDVLKIVADASGLPVFGLYESYLGYGIVGGRLVSMTLQGKKAAEISTKILQGNGTLAASPFEDGEDTCVTAFDWRQLKRHNISESELPTGSTVMYREATAWDLYKSYIVGAVSLIALESVLIVALVLNLRRRKRAEIALLNSRQDLKILAGRLISAQEEELSRLSREFHDDLAQRLAAVAIESGTLELNSKHADPAMLQRIKSIKDQLIGLSEDIHAISRQIHPSILDDLGLVRAIDSQCVRFSERENIPVNFRSRNIPESIPKDVALCIYRITQESLRNIAKHSRAGHVEIDLSCANGLLSLRIVDDGIGFVPRCVRHTPGIGLASMRERVQYVNGEFNIRSEPGEGAVVEVTVPLGKGKE